MVKGCVYILTNSSFKENWVKIGKSSRTADVRKKELDTTGVPLPFDVFAILETSRFAEAENLVHTAIDNSNPAARIRKNREFFNIPPENALEILKGIAPLLDDAEVVYENKDEIPTNGRTRNLTFEMIGIPIGSELHFVEDEAIRAVTLDNKNSIEIQTGELSGTAASLSAATAFVKHILDPNCKQEYFQGGLFWTYKGRKLTDMRKEKELIKSAIE